jgi:hypothetical protein
VSWLKLGLDVFGLVLKFGNVALIMRECCPRLPRILSFLKRYCSRVRTKIPNLQVLNITIKSDYSTTLKFEICVNSRLKF